MLCHGLEENLTIYLDGSLTPGAERECTAHLLHCTECRDLLSAVQETIQACRTLPTPEPPATLTARIMLRTAGSLLHFEHRETLYELFHK
jgi:anti-sigma factor RsiW